jgi:hypothetical protein
MDCSNDNVEGSIMFHGLRKFNNIKHLGDVSCDTQMFHVRNKGQSYQVLRTSMNIENVSYVSNVSLAAYNSREREGNTTTSPTITQTRPARAPP